MPPSPLRLLQIARAALDPFGAVANTEIRQQSGCSAQCREMVKWRRPAPCGGAEIPSDLREMAKNRDEFTPATKRKIERQARGHCSNPTCRRLTHAASSDGQGELGIGEA